MDFLTRALGLSRNISARLKGYPTRKVLVLEGGGMRGVFLTGVLQAFKDRGYFPFEQIIGSSAGALTGDHRLLGRRPDRHGICGRPDMAGKGCVFYRTFDFPVYLHAQYSPAGEAYPQS